VRPSRTAAALPDDALVFCSFNAPHKISGEMFGAWLRILAAVPGSVLWLWHDQPRARANLRDAAAAAGIDPDRLVFAASLPQAEHLARLGLADLFLDSFPYGAHTTASDALSQGVPIVTRAGRSFASRVATSLLHAVDLPELSTSSLGDYEALAIALASDPARLLAVKARLAAAIPVAPLFDPVRFARHLEAAFEAMDVQARSGAAPADFDVPPLPLATA
jgi:protein O-GlcNAc transferase